jgi:hypothetical protein
MGRYDAVLVPGGGLQPDGELRPWVIPRLDRALERHDTGVIVTLSAGTVHKPPPLGNDGFPIHEAEAGARYLLGRGLEPAQLLTEKCSYDTIGNAFFSRVIHVDPRSFQHLLVITSEFHLPRAEAVFRAVYALPGAIESRHDFRIEFEATPNASMAPDSLEERLKDERAGLERWNVVSQRFRTLADLHAWLYTEHEAYASGKRPQRRTGPALGTY